MEVWQGGVKGGGKDGMEQKGEGTGREVWNGRDGSITICINTATKSIIQQKEKKKKQTFKKKNS